ncbi:hypothetical protein [Candidatus Tokpelaia sp.]|uniref:hypothetical protein n=1 Tax=Candidatus Tokpelaia sp. TaxID=2233777 RepID=UPI00123A3B0A|nr:hypothetical protein [Candidatus Tokpelaia sp.]KAA6406268.1 hypothetical protein DPQ22_00140 [Candidatus Tokpelaia sp.]
MSKLPALTLTILLGLSLPGLASSNADEYQKEIDTHQEEKDQAYWEKRDEHLQPSPKEAVDDHKYRFGEDDPEYENQTAVEKQFDNEKHRKK